MYCFENYYKHVEGNWYKDRKEIREVDILSNRIKFIEDGFRRKILIKNCMLSDIGEYEFRVVTDKERVSNKYFYDKLYFIAYTIIS